jgi:Flp pilus assembly protein TadD
MLTNSAVVKESLGAVKDGDRREDAEISDAGRLVAQGAVRKALGLKTPDLRLGLDLARTQLQRGALEEAFRTYVALVLCDPSDTELQVGLSNCALHVSEYNLALQAASVVVALSPTDPRGYFLSGRACLALGLIPEAKEDLDRAAELARKAKDGALYAEAQKFLSIAESPS